MLIEYAIEGKISANSVEFTNDPKLDGYVARTIWVLGRPGVVSEIIGLEEITKKPNVIKILNRFLPGNHLTEDMIGTERQVLMRFYTIGKSEFELDEINRYISDTIQVIDHEGMSLIADLYVPSI
jgi:hypothetical protein